MQSCVERDVLAYRVDDKRCEDLEPERRERSFRRQHRDLHPVEARLELTNRPFDGEANAILINSAFQISRRKVRDAKRENGVRRFDERRIELRLSTARI